MKQIEYIDTINLPTYAACYLVNGDSSGISDDDIKTIDNWTDSLDYDCLSFDFGNSDDYQGSYFTSDPEFGLSCDCEEVRLYGYKKA